MPNKLLEKLRRRQSRVVVRKPRGPGGQPERRGTAEDSKTNDVEKSSSSRKAIPVVPVVTGPSSPALETPLSITSTRSRCQPMRRPVSSAPRRPLSRSPSLTPLPPSPAHEVEIEALDMEVQATIARCKKEEIEVDILLAGLLRTVNHRSGAQDDAEKIRVNMLGKEEQIEAEEDHHWYADDPESWPTWPCTAPPDYLSIRIRDVEMPLDPVPPYPECGWYGGSMSSSTGTTAAMTRIGRDGSFLDVHMGSRSGSSDKYDRAVRCWFPGHVYERDDVDRLSRNDA